jgi:dihydrofolate synthase / folylpolyglutamate synthase
MSSFPSIVDPATALDYLLGRINYERTVTIAHHGRPFRLQRMLSLLELLGNPHHRLPAVHITGTKGKGSTALMVASIAAAAGYRVGLYTSPHLEMLEERFVVAGKQISSERLVELVQQIRPAVDALDDQAKLNDDGDSGPTFFEVTTAIAMLHFAAEKVDLAVLEVGLGGRLDSTNVCRPVATAITSISFDHMKQLGNTLDAIAREKAGIIKPGVPMVSGVTQDEPFRAIAEIAAQEKAPLLQIGSTFVAHSHGPGSGAGERMTYEEFTPLMPGAPLWSLADVEVAMSGNHQVSNAAIAIALAHVLATKGYAIDEPSIRRGLASARATGRIERVKNRPAVILDVAHNVASIDALADVISRQFPHQRRILVIASSRDKETAAMLRGLLPLFEHVILTCYLLNPRAVEPEQMLAMARSIVDVDPTIRATLETADSPELAYRRAMQLATPDDVVCITGSFFLAGEIRPLLALDHDREAAN